MATKLSYSRQVKNAYKGPAKFKIKAVGGSEEFTAMLNPDSFTISYSDATSGGCSKKVEQTADSKAYPIKVVSLNYTINLSLLIDGTGAITPPAEAGKLTSGFVAKQIDDFKNIAVLYSGKDHSTKPLKIFWGKALSYKVQLTKLNINYTLFDRSGNPLRAKLDCTFEGFQNWDEVKKKFKDQSPDLTHVRTVKAGDTLPLMCYRIYKDASYYPQVAKANKLRSIMDIQPGQRIYFPPLRVS